MTASLRERLSAVPLKVQLPLVMVAVLALALGTVVVVLGQALERAAVESAHERLARAARSIADVSTASVASRVPRYRSLAQEPRLRSALRGEPVSPAALEAILERAHSPDDDGMPVELWTSGGVRLALSGRDIAMPRATDGMPLHISEAISATPALLSSDSIGLSPLYRGDGIAHIWFVYPVRDAGRTVGFITHQRRPVAGPSTMGVVSEMSGTPVTLYYRSLSGDVWANSDGKLVPRPENTGSGDAEALVSERRMGAFPVVVSLQVPRGGVLARPRGATRIALVMSAVVLVLGAMVSWLVARNLTRPLVALTTASEHVAAGNYAVRVPVRGSAEVKRLAESFNAMAAEVESTRAGLDEQRRRAESASSAKSDFLAVMSHELRTPLNAIGGYVQLLDMELRGPLSEAQREDLRRIRLSQEHLLALISRVLDLARIEAGTVRYDLEPTPLQEFLRELEGLVAPQVASRALHFQLSVPGDVAVQADREKLRQILLNLLSNAIRHTPPGGQVRIDVERTAPVRIIVSDSGPGIPAHRREVIFEPFVQLERSRAQTQEGLGLGLAISRDLARGMKGDVALEQGAGGPGGARFVLTLPAATQVPGLFAESHDARARVN